MAANKRSTIKEVALAAGTSIQTVSRVMNNRPDVSPETRQRVQKVIEMLEYQPSALARSLIQQRSFTLGVVTAGLKYIGPSQSLNGITNAAEGMGYSLLLKELPRFHANHVLPLIQSLISHHVDGIIWAVPEIGDNRDWLDDFSSGLPVPMTFVSMAPRPRVSSVTVDNYQGAQMATVHLLEQGYRHIGHIAGPMDWWESRQRWQAWSDTLLETGLPVSNDHWTEGNWSSASAVPAIEQLMKKYPQMDAIFVANDQMALSVLQMASRRGLKVPQDLAVVGFDGIPESAYFWPPLTTICQDQNNVGGTAVAEIIKTIESIRLGEIPENKSIWIKPTITIRNSSVQNYSLT